MTERLDRQALISAGPSGRVVANYGFGSGGDTTDYEAEVEELERRVKNIDYALEALTETERKIVEMRYMERHRDFIIYYYDVPMSSATFYKSLKRAVITVADVVGLSPKEKLKKN